MGDEQVAVSMENVSSMELFKQPDGRFFKVLYNVDLTVSVGECHGILGENRFELQLLAEIAGSVKPHESGRCSLMEIGMMRQKRRILPHVYYINDQKVLFEHMHVLGYLMFASEHAPGKPEVKQADWLKLLLKTGLYPFTLTYIRSLNAAEYALVSALLAYASKAVLIVMDCSAITVPDKLTEPFAALMRELIAAGKTVVLTNTSAGLIQKACTHASFLIDGTVTTSGPVSALCETYDKNILRIVSPEPERALAALRGAFADLRFECGGQTVSAYGGRPVAVSSAAAALERAGIPFSEIQTPAPSLAEAFREVKRTL
jgi:ABC-type multidrug transport system ATPase subunit